MDESKIGYIEEYKSLREEVLKRQDARNNTLGLTVTAIGTIVALSLGIGRSAEFSGFVSALIILSYILVIAAVIFTIHQTQQIDNISAFIRIFIEPNVEGIGWETIWTELRKRKGPEGNEQNKKVKLPLGTSKYLAAYYVFITIGLFLLVFFLPIDSCDWPFFVILGLATASIGFELDLALRLSRGWKVWNEFERLASEKKLESLLVVYKGREERPRNGVEP